VSQFRSARGEQKPWRHASPPGPCRRGHPWRRRHYRKGLATEHKHISMATESLPSAERGVAVLGDLLVGLLGGTASGLRDLLGNEVGTLLERIHCNGLW
jgi:hypothetical protein